MTATAAANSGHFVVNGADCSGRHHLSGDARHNWRRPLSSRAPPASPTISMSRPSTAAAYSGWNSRVHVSVAGTNHAPTVSLPAGGQRDRNGGADAFNSRACSAATDATATTLTYYLYDANNAANSGHFMVGGNEVPAETDRSASPRRNWRRSPIVAGAAGTADDINVQAFDGQPLFGMERRRACRGGRRRQPRADRQPARRRQRAANAGQSLQLSSLFSGSDRRRRHADLLPL